jgi:hypothetical protein
MIRFWATFWAKLVSAFRSDGEHSGTEARQQVGKGVASFGRELSGGLERLKQLRGGGASVVLTPASPVACGGGYDPCAPPAPLGSGGEVYLPVGAAKSWGTNLHMVVVHELAHIVDWHSDIGGRSFSQAWPYEPITAYARDGWPPPWDRFAEAVAVYVYGSTYSQAATSFLVVDYRPQMSAMRGLLEGWK